MRVLCIYNPDRDGWVGDKRAGGASGGWVGGPGLGALLDNGLEDNTPDAYKQANLGEIQNVLRMVQFGPRQVTVHLCKVTVTA